MSKSKLSALVNNLERKRAITEIHFSGGVHPKFARFSDAFH
ncbi:MAG: hypothetical protein U9M97_04635 [Candidatus Hadarchaeota archaeon]|nr:hypothetical protein [Candidatus Hadarchaeota archaeon]